MEEQDENDDLKKENDITLADNVDNVTRLLEVKFENPNNIIPNPVLAKRFNISERKIAQLLKKNGYVWDKSKKTYLKADGEIKQKSLKKENTNDQKSFVLLNNNLKISQEAYVLLILMTNGDEHKMGNFISKAILKTANGAMKKRLRGTNLIDLKNKFRLAVVVTEKKENI